MNASEWPRFVGASGCLLLHWLRPAAEPLPIVWAWTYLQVSTYPPDPRRFQSIEGDRVAVVYYPCSCIHLVTAKTETIL